MSGLQSFCNLVCCLGSKRVLVGVVVCRMEKRPLLDRLLSRRLILFHISEIIDRRFLCQIRLVPLVLGFRSLDQFDRLCPVRFFHLRCGTSLLLSDGLLFLFLAEIYDETLLRGWGRKICQTTVDSE